VRSVPDAIGQFLNEYLKKMSEETVSHEVPQLELGLAEMASGAQMAAEPVKEKKGKIRFNLCPSCGMYTFGYFEGCAKCLSCGHSEC
jgi:ribonucleoside-diphosphate reductase alpha chain